MSWFTEKFIDSAKSSWLAGYIDPEKIPALFRLLDCRDDVLALHDGSKEELNRYFQAALAYRNNSPEYRQSIATLSSIRSSRDSSIFSALPESRNSLASDITAFSNTSANSPHSRWPSDIGHGLHNNASSAQTQASPTCRGPSAQPRSRNLPPNEKKYFCPRCPGVGTVRRADFLKHLKYHCEAPRKGFACLRCDTVELEETSILEHKRMHDHAYSEFELPPKKAYGCPFCGSLQQSLDAYSRCMCKDQEADPVRLPRPSLRVRALLQQHDIKPTLILECRRRGFAPNAWSSMTWDDANSTWFAERLEYGCIESNDPYRLGVFDILQFISMLLDLAEFEHTEITAPVIADHNQEEPRANPLGDRNIHPLESFPSDNASTQALQPPWSHHLDFRLAESSSETNNDIRRGTAAAIQNQQSEFPRSFSPLAIRQLKRAPSTNASNLEDARSRSRQPPISRKLTQWIAGDEHVLPQFLDPALLTLGEAFYEQGHGIQPTSTHGPSESQAISDASLIHPTQTKIHQDLFQQ